MNSPRRAINAATHLLQLGRIQAAESMLHTLTESAQRRPGALHVRGLCCVLGGRVPEALPLLEAAVKARPADASFRHNLGSACWLAGHRGEALRHLRKAVVLAPGNTGFRETLASALRISGRPQDAGRHWRRLAHEHPDNARFHAELGRTCLDLWKLGPALSAFRRAVERRPRDAAVWLGLGAVYSRLGDERLAEESINHAGRLRPNAETLSARIRALSFCTGVGSDVLVQAHRSWEARFAPPRKPAPRRPRRPGRIRVAYLSALFREHAIVLYPLIHGHSAARFEIWCFDDRSGADPAWAEHWISSAGLSNDELARILAEREIDIAVDCDGHFRGGVRLPVFAARPARRQVALSIYPGPLAGPLFDAQVGDAILTPPGRSLLRLPVFLCFEPDKHAPPVGGLPMLRTGHVTFGSFSLPLKINNAVAQLWSSILHAVPDSRLLLHHHMGRPGAPVDRAIAQRLRRVFRTFGVDPDRLELVGTLPPDQHLRLYRRVDVALDPFPYNGNTTTLRALWMGVPVVTLEGQTLAGRVGASLLSAAGLGDWVARDELEYKSIAVRAVRDPAGLAGLRRRLRGQLKRSPVTDSASYVCALEQAFSRMVKSWRE